MVKQTLETITPALAATWLKQNKRNRPLKEKIVRLYANAMLNEQWVVNGESLKFDIHGTLLDGQHRLEAIVRSGISIKSFVVRDLPTEIFNTLDQGAKRTIMDLLSLKGEKYTASLGPALRLIYVQNEFGSVKDYNTYAGLITSKDLLDVLDDHPEVRYSVQSVCKHDGVSRKMHTVMPESYAIFCHWLFSRIDKGKADEFFDKLKSGADLSASNPILALRNKLDAIQERGAAVKAHRKEMIGITIKGWNLWRKGKESINPRLQQNEDFPVAV